MEGVRPKIEKNSWNEVSQCVVPTFRYQSTGGDGINHRYPDTPVSMRFRVYVTPEVTHYGFFNSVSQNVLTSAFWLNLKILKTKEGEQNSHFPSDLD